MAPPVEYGGMTCEEDRVICESVDDWRVSLLGREQIGVKLQSGRSSHAQQCDVAMMTVT